MINEMLSFLCQKTERLKKSLKLLWQNESFLGVFLNTVLLTPKEGNFINFIGNGGVSQVCLHVLFFCAYRITIKRYTNICFRLVTTSVH